MNVLHIDDQRGWRGGEQQASYLIAGLARLGVGNVVAGRADGEFLARQHGTAEIIRVPIPCRGELDPISVYRVVRAIKRHDVQIVHAHSSHAHAYACLARLCAPSVKTVVTRRVDFSPRRGALNQWKYSAPDAVATVSACIKDVLLAYGIEERKLHVIHSAIDERRFEVATHTRASENIGEDVPVIGNVAALVGHKDHETLIRAMALVVKQRPDALLLIAGEGDQRDRIVAEIARLDLTDNVRLLGYREDIPALLPLFDVFVLSSKMEGLGTSVLDAMACRVPVVATDAGGIPEMVLHEQTGILAPCQTPEKLADAILGVLADRASAEERVERAHAMVREHFSVEAMVQRYFELYNTLLES